MDPINNVFGADADSLRSAAESISGDKLRKRSQVSKHGLGTSGDRGCSPGTSSAELDFRSEVRLGDRSGPATARTSRCRLVVFDFIRFLPAKQHTHMFAYRTCLSVMLLPSC